jgi:hypothetical protein
MSYKEQNPVAAFMAALAIGIVIGLPIGGAFLDSRWQKKLVKDGKYHWIVDENGTTNLVPKP